jgi:hypothetical protein
MYKHDQSFRGISVLLIGDFIQLPVTTGITELEKVGIKLE